MHPHYDKQLEFGDGLTTKTEKFVSAGYEIMNYSTIGICRTKILPLSYNFRFENVKSYWRRRQNFHYS